ncbi:hypothetical protein Tco_1284037, partial [Tanacetum coccineum]
MYKRGRGLKEVDEDWDLIRAKIEANAELSKSVLGSGLQGEDFAKKMVELVNQRKKHFAEEEQELKEISHDPITAENIYDELLEESGDMEAFPVAINNPPSIATYRSSNMERKVVYTIVRKMETDIVYGMDKPEDELEKWIVIKLTKFMYKELNLRPSNPPWNLPFLGAKGLTSPEQMATGVNTPGSDENSLKLYDLIADMKGSQMEDIEVSGSSQVEDQDRGGVDSSLHRGLNHHLASKRGLEKNSLGIGDNGPNTRLYELVLFLVRNCDIDLIPHYERVLGLQSR